jgi:hypothetical protein
MPWPQIQATGSNAEAAEPCVRGLPAMPSVILMFHVTLRFGPADRLRQDYGASRSRTLRTTGHYAAVQARCLQSHWSSVVSISPACSQ